MAGDESADPEWRTVVSGLAFPEGVRWRAGELWLSDVFARRILRIEEGAGVRTVAHVPGRPAGLGWRPDGTLLAVSMTDRRVLAVAEGATRVVAELGGLAGGDCNDMIVDGAGRAYVGNFGYDYAGGEPRRATTLLLVEPGGAARPVAEDVWFPNGMALGPGGDTLYLAETPAERLSCFTVGPGGTLHERRTTDLDGLRPDGIALDSEGALWVASPGTGELARVDAEGAILERGPAPGGAVQACALGGPDGATLFVCGTPTHDENEALEARTGRVYARRVGVPAACLA
jgi:sugar lactone lactonase YvrE